MPADTCHVVKSPSGGSCCASLAASEPGVIISNQGGKGSGINTSFLFKVSFIKKSQYSVLPYDLYMKAGKGILQLKPLSAQSTTLDFEI